MHGGPIWPRTTRTGRQIQSRIIWRESNPTWHTVKHCQVQGDPGSTLTLVSMLKNPIYKLDFLGDREISLSRQFQSRVTSKSNPYTRSRAGKIWLQLDIIGADGARAWFKAAKVGTPISPLHYSSSDFFFFSFLYAAAGRPEYKFQTLLGPTCLSTVRYLGSAQEFDIPGLSSLSKVRIQS